MKKTVIALLSALTLGAALNFAAAKNDPTVKEIIDRTTKKEKTEKLGKKEAKDRKAKGWIVIEGSLPMERQFQDAFAYDLATDNDEQPYFFTGQGEYTSTNKGAAYKFAHQAAIMDLVNNMEINMAGGASTEVNDTDGVATTSGSSNTKSIAAKKLAGLQPVVKIYRKDGDQYSVMVRVYYSRKLARELDVREQAAKIKSDEKLKQDVEGQLDKLIDENK